MLMGRLTADPITKQIGDATLCTFSLAVNKTRKGEKTVKYVDCEAWRQVADYIAKFAKKGDAVYCDAEIEQDSYEDKNGNPRTKFKFVVTPMTFGFCAKSKTDEPAATPAPVGVAPSDDDEDVPY